jgi:biotin carboxyl carrier protein
MTYEITVNDVAHTVSIEPLGDPDDQGLRSYRIQVDDQPPVEIERGWPVPSVLSLIVGGRSFDAGLVSQDDGYTVELLGVHHEVAVIDPRRKALRMADAADSGAVITQMPGRIIKILVELGQHVEKGEPVVVVEAMKMENQLKAPADGTVRAIRISEGALVDAKTTLIELDPD